MKTAIKSYLRMMFGILWRTFKPVVVRDVRPGGLYPIDSIIAVGSLETGDYIRIEHYNGLSRCVTHNTWGPETFWRQPNTLIHTTRRLLEGAYLRISIPIPVPFRYFEMYWGRYRFGFWKLSVVVQVHEQIGMPDVQFRWFIGRL